MSTFSEILARKSVFTDRNVLSPAFIPVTLPFRDKEIEKIMVAVSPALKAERPRNLFVYGKTGTGKTACVKKVMAEFEGMNSKGIMVYVNCFQYNSRYRVVQKLAQSFAPELDKAGFGITLLHEKLLAWIGSGGRHLIVVLDEVDKVKDLNDLVYTFTRANDELKAGSISLLGISNDLKFKEALDPRSRSSLFETEMVFPSYTAHQLAAILRQRADLGFAKGIVDESAVNLGAALTASDSGDARYALRLLLRAGEIADETNTHKVTDKEVDAARRSVDEDVAIDAISTMPEQHQLVLLATARLTISGSRYAKLADEPDSLLLSGEVYEEYCAACKQFGRRRRSARWFRQYLNELELFGLITIVESGKGMRGHSRLVRIGHDAKEVMKIVERNLSIIGTSGEEAARSTPAKTASTPGIGAESDDADDEPGDPPGTEASQPLSSPAARPHAKGEQSRLDQHATKDSRHQPSSSPSAAPVPGARPSAARAVPSPTSHPPAASGSVVLPARPPETVNEQSLEKDVSALLSAHVNGKKIDEESD